MHFDGVFLSGLTHSFSRAPVEEPWLQFSEQGGFKYWYNFATGERSSTEPYGV
jgi:hypothetical protein